MHGLGAWVVGVKFSHFGVRERVRGRETKGQRFKYHCPPLPTVSSHPSFFLFFGIFSLSLPHIPHLRYFQILFSSSIVVVGIKRRSRSSKKIPLQPHRLIHLLSLGCPTALSPFRPLKIINSQLFPIRLSYPSTTPPSFLLFSPPTTCPPLQTRQHPPCLHQRKTKTAQRCSMSSWPS